MLYGDQPCFSVVHWMRSQQHYNMTDGAMARKAVFRMIQELGIPFVQSDSQEPKIQSSAPIKGP